MRHIDRATPPTRHIIFNLLGDYVNPAGGAAWTSALLGMLRVLGVRERAARSTLSRMKRSGWLESRRKGRRSLYKLTPRTRDLLEEGTRRLFGLRPESWDGTWSVITYSLPGERRLTRHRLHTRLSWLGFGNLLPGILIGAFPRAAEVRRVLYELEVHPYVHVFTGARLDPTEQDRVLTHCWDLPAIDALYGEFLDLYAPVLREIRTRPRRAGGLPAEQAFVWRFWATYDYLQFPRIDPFLPDELLPRGWRGSAAFQLLAELRALLQQPTDQFLRGTLARPTGPLRHSAPSALPQVPLETRGAVRPRPS